MMERWPEAFTALL